LLTICQHCPFREQCIQRVQPRRSRFDGICGGHLWLDGQIGDTCDGAHADELDEGKPFIVHGTEAGARAHRRRGEDVCSLCREAARLAQAERRARKRTATP